VLVVVEDDLLDMFVLEVLEWSVCDFDYFVEV
jgi:hypothetical protein